MNWHFGLLLALASVAAVGCDAKSDKSDKSSPGRSDAVASASREMSGPSLLSSDRLEPALQALQAKAGGQLLRLEIRPRELTLQAEDASNPGAVLELHYRDGKIGEPEHATLRGKGQLGDNLFDITELKLEAIPELVREAVGLVRVPARSSAVAIRRPSMTASVNDHIDQVKCLGR